MRKSLKTLLITLVALVCAMLFMFTAFANALGDVDGKEPVLMYSSDLVASIVPDNKRLRCFTKVELKAGESKTVTFRLPAHELAFVGADGKWIIEEGDFVIKIGDQTQKIQCSTTKVWNEPNI